MIIYLSLVTKPRTGRYTRTTNDWNLYVHTYTCEYVDNCTFCQDIVSFVINVLLISVNA